MDKEDKSSGSSGLIALVLVLVGAVFVARPALDSSRPDTGATKAMQVSGSRQDIDARLWQDPFAAVAAAREAPPAPAAQAAIDDRHSEGGFRTGLQRLAEEGGEGGAVVYAVTLSSGPYAEQAESRRRTRYAVLAALSARGFAPQDNEHLGYFVAAAATDTDGLKEVVPFEIFVPTPGQRDRPDDCDGCRLVVLWLDSAHYQTQPLHRLGGLAQRLALPQGAPPVRWRVLGPSNSDALRAVAVEVDTDPGIGQALRPHDLRLFSAAATAPDATVLRGLKSVKGDETLSAYLSRHDVALLRTIGSDERLASTLVHELELRGLRARPTGGMLGECPRQGEEQQGRATPHGLPSAVAIVTEWDTLYGRSLRQQFRYDPHIDKPGFCVTRWHYLRGLDGRLANAAPQTAPESRPKKDESRSDPLSFGEAKAPVERAEGQSQLDYLRRLAIDIRDEDARLRRLYGRNYGIRAIGVLGNDVYDKLLVVQALQAELPHAIFFTTDLDARLFHPREQAWTRNLIVASNFGLRLAEPLQRGFAPFRDSYQSSAFLATLLAMADAGQAIADQRAGQSKAKPRFAQASVDRWLQQPRLFEISRSGVFDFSDAMSIKDVPAAVDASRRCGRWRLEQCDSLHPPGSPLVGDSSKSARMLVAITLTAALWLPALALSRNARRRVRRFVAAAGPSRRALRGLLLLGAAAALIVLPAILLAWAWPMLAEAMTRNGKPLSFTDGISPWPTYAIRLGTLLLCAYLVAAAWGQLRDNLNQIAVELHLGASWRLLRQALADEDPARTRRQRLVDMFEVRMFPQRPLRPDGPRPMSAAAWSFWKHYVVQNRAPARLIRTLLCVALMLGLTWLIYRAMGEAPVAPQRGALSASMQQWTTLPTDIAVQFLIFFVADATVLSVLFVRGLRHQSSNWPPRTLQIFSERTGLPDEYLDDWIDLQFVARRTACVGTLVYYPFVVLSLLIAARSAFFDDWYSPPYLTVVVVISFGILLLCALALRRTAEASRAAALEHLRDAILRAQGSGNGRLEAQLKNLQSQVQALNKGAFAPYLQQPLLKAVLLPLLTFGGSSLFDYLSMLNL